MKRVPLVAVVLLSAACADAAREVDGVFIVGVEVQTLRPCDGPRTFWVIGDQAVLTALRHAHDSLTSVPYQPVYVRVRGGEAEGGATGAAGRYDGSFRVDSILMVSASVPAHCAPDPDMYLEPPVGRGVTPG